jgi:hypothetical protein
MYVPYRLPMKLFVVWGVIAAEPLAQIVMRRSGLISVDLLDVLVIDGPFHQ